MLSRTNCPNMLQWPTARPQPIQTLKTVSWDLCNSGPWLPEAPATKPRIFLGSHRAWETLSQHLDIDRTSSLSKESNYVEIGTTKGTPKNNSKSPKIEPRLTDPLCVRIEI